MCFQSAVRTRTLVRLAVLFGAAALHGCGDGGSSARWAGVVRDSAGVTVVVNPEDGLWGEGEAWSVALDATFGGGADETRPEYLFGEISALAVDARGTVYVADATAQQVRAFASDGTHLRSYGSPGSGPGELGSFVNGVAVSGNTLFVVDAIGNDRITTFDRTSGAHLGSVPYDLSAGLPIRWDSSDEHLLVVQRRMASFGGEPTPVETGGGDPVVVLGADGEVGDTLVVLPPGRSFQMSGGEARLRILEAEPVWDVGHDGRLAFGLNSEYRIEERDASGRTERVVTRPFTPRPVTESDRESILDALRGLMEEQGLPSGIVDQMVSGQEFAESYPAFTSLLVGPEGTLWVQRIRTADELDALGFDMQDLGSSEWEVFDADGRYLGVVTVPERVQPMLVRGDAIYGVARDDFEVQTVVRLAIQRGGGP